MISTPQLDLFSPAQDALTTPAGVCVDLVTPAPHGAPTGRETVTCTHLLDHRMPVYDVRVYASAYDSFRIPGEAPGVHHVALARRLQEIA